MTNKGLQCLTREEAIALLACISYNLEQSEDSRDFCLWLTDVFKEEAGIDINLSSKTNQ